MKAEACLSEHGDGNKGRSMGIHLVDWFWNHLVDVYDQPSAPKLLMGVLTARLRFYWISSLNHVIDRSSLLPWLSLTWTALWNTTASLHHAPQHSKQSLYLSPPSGGFVRRLPVTGRLPLMHRGQIHISTGYLVAYTHVQTHTGMGESLICTAYAYKPTG